MDWLNLAIAAGTLIAALIGYVAWRETHSDRARDRQQVQIDQTVVPLSNRLDLLEQKFADTMAHNQEMLEVVLARQLQPLSEQVRVLETKMDVFWKSVAVDAAKILHQPDPKRAHIDKLLEAFMEDTLTEDEELQLRKYLVTIRNWEVGMEVGFPVHPGEQTAAAILLRTMTHVITPRGRVKEDDGSDS